MMKSLLRTLYTLLLAAIPAYAQVITVVAGNGTPGFCGDGGLATSACLNEPRGIDVDAAGNLYIADSNNMRVRKVSPSGIITTVAGNGIGDFTGDVGQATSESLWFPVDVVADASGNIYIVDNGNNRIRKVDSQGLMKTVAGGGPCCGLSDGGPATHAVLNTPRGVAVDVVGNLYIADNAHHRIRRVAANGRISTIAGNGGTGVSGDGGPATAATLSSPWGVAVDIAGNVYFAADSRIRKVSPGGTIVTVAGGGTQWNVIDGIPATRATLGVVRGLVVDRNGNLYFLDDSLNSSFRVRKVGPDGIITSVVGGLGYNATDLALDSAGNLYIADHRQNRILKITF